MGASAWPCHALRVCVELLSVWLSSLWTGRRSGAQRTFARESGSNPGFPQNDRKILHLERDTRPPSPTPRPHTEHTMPSTNTTALPTHLIGDGTHMHEWDTRTPNYNDRVHSPADWMRTLNAMLVAAEAANLPLVLRMTDGTSVTIHARAVAMIRPAGCDSYAVGNSEDGSSLMEVRFFSNARVAITGVRYMDGPDDNDIEVAGEFIAVSPIHSAHINVRATFI